MITDDHPLYHNILLKCRSLIGEMQAHPPTKISREQNAVANLLAKEGTKAQLMEPPKIICDMPSFVVACVEADINGTMFHFFVKHSNCSLQGWDVAPNILTLAPNPIRSTYFLTPLFYSKITFFKKKKKVKKWMKEYLVMVLKFLLREFKYEK